MYWSPVKSNLSRLFLLDTKSGKLPTEPALRGRRVLKAACENQKLSWELLLLIGDRLLRGELLMVEPSMRPTLGMLNGGSSEYSPAYIWWYTSSWIA